MSAKFIQLISLPLDNVYRDTCAYVLEIDLYSMQLVHILTKSESNNSFYILP